ncbi:MAG: type II toxin-antitoxin system VapC family toxin [Acidobacteria bacterium]|nr:type II toxin-antitoxin system VapC family toxin [Acidobacteriota bacterium]
MRGFLLDTNVVSETGKPDPNPRVVSFLTDRVDLWLSVIVLYELEYGVRLMPPGRRRDARQAKLIHLTARFHRRVLPVGRDEAGHAARLCAHARRTGRTVPMGDALIAGTAAANDLVVATRNTGDFAPFDVEVLNPWNGTAGHRPTPPSTR